MTKLYLYDYYFIDIDLEDSNLKRSLLKKNVSILYNKCIHLISSILLFFSKSMYEQLIY